MRTHWLKLRTLAFLIFACVTGPLRAEDVAAAFTAANHLFEQQKYSEAAAAYEGIIKAGHRSSALYYNVGNAYFKSGQTGRAIAAYRNAEKLAPRDPDVQANLQFARDQVQNAKAPSHGIWSSFLARLTLNEWTLLTAVFVWLWFLLLAFGQIKPQWRKPLRGYAVTLGIVTLCLIGCTTFAAKQQLIKAAVVVRQEAVVRRGPFDESQSAFTLRDGAELTILDRRENWIEVADTSNRIGWIPDGDVSVVQ